MALTMQQMTRSTPRLVIGNSEDVKLLRAHKKWASKDRKFVRIQAIVQTRDGTPHPKRRVTIENVKPGELKLGVAAVRVHCTCEFFTWYGCADVLHRRGSGWEKYATGHMPDIRNPTYIPFVCKHLIKVFRVIQRKNM